MSRDSEPPIERLTDTEYWDSTYAHLSIAPSTTSHFKTLLKTLLGPTVLEYMRDYRDYLIWDVIYPKFLLRKRGARVLEVGSAPGYHLIKLQEAFGFEPYGVEYSPTGVDLNRKLFELHGINPSNVIHADFLSQDFQKQYEAYFDVVVSRGFIEHFTDVDSVVSKHLNVLAPGGRVVVTIPNLRGVNYFLTWMFRKELIPLHNILIMRRDDFCKLFSRPDLTPLMCGYYGTFSFGLFNTRPDSKMRHVFNICVDMQRVLNAIFRLAFRTRGAETGYFSPYLIFIGAKKS
jgi:SAM-dependent methyltransferase